MKIYRKAAFCLALAALAISSCVKEKPMSGNPVAGQPVTIRLNTSVPPTGGSDPNADPADREVNSLRVLIYNSVGGNLAFNIPVPTIPVPGSPATLTIRTGTYDFVFIANENSDPALAALLAVDANIDNISKLRAMSFARGAFDAAKDIPMVTYIQQVNVAGDNQIKTPDMTGYQTGIWDVALERAAIRLKFVITLTASQYTAWTGSNITVANIPSKAYVLPGKDNSASQVATGETFSASASAGSPGLISAPDVSGNVTVTYDRLILPESVLSTVNNVSTNAMTLSMTFGADTKSANITTGVPADGFAITRNTYLLLNTTVKENGLDIQAIVEPWGDASGDYTFNGQYHLTVDKSRFIFTSAAGSQPISVVTDYPTGWSVISQVGAWFTTPSQLNGTITVMAPNTGTTPLSGSFVIAAGNLRKTIYVTQFPDAGNITDSQVADGFIPYVGAFWKANQTGERLIRLVRTTSTTNAPSAADGDWTATVIVGADWIILDRAMTTDANVGWRPGATEASVQNGNDAGFDVNHPVSGNVPTVSGTLRPTTDPGYQTGDENIYFRIGLKSQYTPTAAAPARYGVVVLSYKNNTLLQRIWIRQGEGDDYLMRNSDPINSGGLTSRTVCKQFSPYNLTVATANLNTRAGLNGAGPNPGIFTAYPTQAGAMFQWANVTNNRIAWDAYNVVTAGPAWQNNAPSTYWDTLSATDETCPAGYRRPADGAINAPVTFPLTTANMLLSEPRQSLWTNPDNATTGSTDNNVWGYYADGFFDRRAIGPSGNGYANSAVSISGPGVALIGRLFFNPNSSSYASLFFPAPGYRMAANGQLDLAGLYGFYWTSSSIDQNNGWILYLSNNRAFQYDDQRPRGFSVRCVRP